MRSGELRRLFLGFFERKGHVIVPSAVLPVRDDPTLLFVNAGMVQFKDVFLGLRVAPAPRVANTQRCLRVSGKHNDLEAVGHDGYHHTFFEMLGNWSFGDYFKREAIEWAWEFLTEVLGLPSERFCVTVFGGEGDLAPDTDAEALWRHIVPEGNIVRGSMKDNFWEMGEVGPCGPCTEIHIDLRGERERRALPTSQLVNRGDPRVIELWNIVFIQFDRRRDGTLQPLSSHFVDTGMGLERLAMVMQGKSETYESDLLHPLIAVVEETTGRGFDEAEVQPAMRVVADHTRAVVWAIADGVLPSNTGAGYVVRRLIRRAVRYYYQRLGIKEPLLWRLAPVVADIYRGAFERELTDALPFVVETLMSEEQNFLETLARGMRRFYAVVETIKKQNETSLPGSEVFFLYDTYGFPPDLTALLASEEGLTLDMKGFEEQLRQQQERARKAQEHKGEWHTVIEGTPRFVGWDTLQVTTRILRWRQVQRREKKLYEFVLEECPFYPEGGGQVGDIGWLEAGGVRIGVVDTQREHDVPVVVCEALPSELNGEVLAVVDVGRRQDIMRHHSATHLLHGALRRVLGTHVRQSGSYLDHNYLRFDFTHPRALTEKELETIETLVNEKIQENIPRMEWRDVPYEEALRMGALAFFGEKYGERVRVIAFDPGFSMELCGGTHVERTGDIGYFHIVREYGVAAGVRRVEAVAGMSAVRCVRQYVRQLGEIGGLVKGAPVPGVEKLVKEVKELRRHLAVMEDRLVRVLAETLPVEERSGVRWVVRVVDAPVEVVKRLALRLAERNNFAVVLGSSSAPKAYVVVALNRQLAARSGMDASVAVREACRELMGGGGGKQWFGEGAGPARDKLEMALRRAVSALESALAER